MKKILLTQWVPDVCKEMFKNELEFVCPSKEKLSFTREEILNEVADADGIFLIFSKADKQVIDAGKKLKVIANLGVGFDCIDVEYATAKNIAVINTPNTVTEATAELTIALMMSVMRNITQYDKGVKNGEWTTFAFADVGSEIFGHTIGVVGFGRIGKCVGKKAAAIGMNVAYYDPFRLSAEEEERLGVTYMSMEDIFSKCDCVSLHMPYTPENHHIVNEKTLAAMKKGSYLINVARGPIVKESALVEALKNGTLKGAALDVFEFEPNISKELKECPNAVLTPHVGTQTLQVRINMFEEAMKGIIAFFEGEKPHNIVNKEILN
ncbi:MAG: 3-phosphoglycerate dehydrogenase [Firmicutes bacterium]|nr:3-phosphoglycerate dehydrogenase [Bacillota bacterium]